jgi:undecaprenyl diphosphate synthase
MSELSLSDQAAVGTGVIDAVIDSAIDAFEVSALRHMMVVGGTFADWRDLGDDKWQERVQELGAAVASVGGTWLTLRAYELGPEAVPLQPWSLRVDGPHGRSCTVIVDPCANGRQRFVDAMVSLDPAIEINESTVASALYDPADCEPDAVLILGPDTQLPPSLVWELAYAELVFQPLRWDQLQIGHVMDAITDFGARRRRFGGLDE